MLNHLLSFLLIPWFLNKYQNFLIYLLLKIPVGVGVERKNVVGCRSSLFFIFLRNYFRLFTKLWYQRSLLPKLSICSVFILYSNLVEVSFKKNFNPFLQITIQYCSKIIVNHRKNENLNNSVMLCTKGINLCKPEDVYLKLYS